MSRPVTGSEITPAHSSVIQGSANATNANANRPGFMRLNLLSSNHSLGARRLGVYAIVWPRDKLH